MPSSNKAQTGSLISICKKTTMNWLETNKIAPGTVRIAVGDMYASYCNYLLKEGFQVKPSIFSFGRIIDEHLPSQKLPSGRYYLINKKIAELEESRHEKL